jgi:hypothetical protein
MTYRQDLNTFRVFHCLILESRKCGLHCDRAGSASIVVGLYAHTGALKEEDRFGEMRRRWILVSAFRGVEAERSTYMTVSIWLIPLLVAKPLRNPHFLHNDARFRCATCRIEASLRPACAAMRCATRARVRQWMAMSYNCELGS